LQSKIKNKDYILRVVKYKFDKNQIKN